MTYEGVKMVLIFVALLLCAMNVWFWLGARADALPYYNRKGQRKVSTGKGYLVLAIIWFADAILWLVSLLVNAR